MRNLNLELDEGCLFFIDLGLVPCETFIPGYLLVDAEYLFDIIIGQFLKV